MVAEGPEDAQTASRQNLLSLRSQLQAAVGKPGVKMTPETRAHLTESISRIDDALRLQCNGLPFHCSRGDLRPRQMLIASAMSLCAASFD